MSSKTTPPPPATTEHIKEEEGRGVQRSGSAKGGTLPSQNTIDVSGLQLEEGDTTTTVAIGQDTYTIGKKTKVVLCEEAGRKVVFFRLVRDDFFFGLVPFWLKQILAKGTN